MEPVGAASYAVFGALLCGSGYAVACRCLQLRAGGRRRRLGPHHERAQRDGARDGGGGAGAPAAAALADSVLGGLPRSPCFAARDPDHDRRALLAAQRYLYHAYVDLAASGTLNNDFALSSYTPAQRASAGQPHQDPLGVLSAALLAVRRRPPVAEHVDPGLGGPDAPALTWNYRRWMAAVLTVSHKMATSCPSHRRNPAELVTGRFMTAAEELAWTTRGCTQRVLSVQASMEAVVASTDIVLRTMEDGPMAHFEAALTRLIANDTLTHSTTIVLRGAAFFYLAAALFGPDEDVLEDLNAWVDTRDIGLGLLNTCIVCGRRDVGAIAEALVRARRRRRIAHAARGGARGARRRVSRGGVRALDPRTARRSARWLRARRSSRRCTSFGRCPKCTSATSERALVRGMARKAK